jgi:hypothetical protein
MHNSIINLKIQIFQKIKKLSKNKNNEFQNNIKLQNN